MNDATLQFKKPSYQWGYWWKIILKINEKFIENSEPVFITYIKTLIKHACSINTKFACSSNNLEQPPLS